MKRLLPTLLGLCCIADASAQLKVQSVLPHGAAPEKTAPAVYDSTANIRTGGDAAYYESLVGQRILFYPRDIHADLRPVAYFNFLAETPAVVRIDTVWLRKPHRKVRPEDFRIDTLYSDTYRPRFYKDETTAACGCTTMESHVLGRNLSDGSRNGLVHPGGNHRRKNLRNNRSQDTQNPGRGVPGFPAPIRRGRNTLLVCTYGKRQNEPAG